MSFVKIDLDEQDKKKKAQAIDWAHIEEEPKDSIKELIELIDDKSDEVLPTFDCFGTYRTDQKNAKMIWAAANLSRFAGRISAETLDCMDSGSPNASSITESMAAMLFYMQILADGLGEDLTDVVSEAKSIAEYRHGALR